MITGLVTALWLFEPWILRVFLIGAAMIFLGIGVRRLRILFPAGLAVLVGLEVFVLSAL